MRRRHPTLARLAAFGCLAVAAVAAAVPAAADQATLGAAGSVYTVRGGSYGELFPGGSELAADTPVLALVVDTPDGPPVSHLVAGTEDPGVESSFGLAFEESTQTAFVVWESTVSYVHSRLNLVGFSGGQWTEVIELSGDVFSLKDSPRIAITRDRYETVGEDGQTIDHTRTVLHIVWWEVAGTGERASYSPVVLVDGRYLGWNPVYLLSDLVPAAEPAAGGPVFDDLERYPLVIPGRDGTAAAVLFGDPVSGRLVGAEIQVLPGALTDLADRARAEIIEAGAGYTPDQLVVFADAVRAEIIEAGVHFHPGVLRFLGDALRAEIIEVGAHDFPNDLVAIADAARAEIIEAGSTFDRDPLATPTPARVLEIPAEVDANGDPVADPGAPSHHLAVREMAAWPLPGTGPGALRLFLSRNARHALVSWEDGNRIYYRETGEAGWSDVYMLHLGPSLDRDKAYALLDERVRNH